MKRRLCICCRETTLPADFPGLICLHCQETFDRDRLDWISGLTIDMEDLATILKLDIDTIKRNHRSGKLPPRLEGVKKYLWSKRVIEDWINAGCPDIRRLQADLAVLRRVHGDVGQDDLTGEETAGERFDIQVQTFDKKSGKMKREGKVITTRLPGHGPYNGPTEPGGGGVKETTGR